VKAPWAGSGQPRRARRLYGHLQGLPLGRLHTRQRLAHPGLRHPRRHGHHELEHLAAGGSSDYDVAYDIWFNQTPTTTCQPNGTELMIWLNHNGPVQPFGSRVASNVSLGGRSYNVWFGKQAWNTVSYTMTSGTSGPVSNLDLQAVIADGGGSMTASLGMRADWMFGAASGAGAGAS
jgi:Glycosyl hydrolase family 12